MFQLYSMIVPLVTLLSVFYITERFLPLNAHINTWDEPFGYKFDFENALKALALGVLAGMVWPIAVPGLVAFYCWEKDKEPIS